jgi:hypothetical protein
MTHGRRVLRDLLVFLAGVAASAFVLTHASRRSGLSGFGLLVVLGIIWFLVGTWIQPPFRRRRNRRKW